MEFKVRLFLGDRLIDPSDYDKVIINCPDVDRIVNDIYERNQRRPLMREEPDAVGNELDSAPNKPDPAAEKASIIQKLRKSQTLVVKEQDAQRTQRRPRTREDAR